MYYNYFTIYHIKHGDSLYSIAEQFHIRVDQIVSINRLSHTPLYVGQPLYIPLMVNRPFLRGLDDPEEYVPVTAHTVTMPVVINGIDINKPPYQAINYKPTGANYPFIYVPLFQFSLVGAKVSWDEATQSLTVASDYFDLKQRIEACHNALRASRLAYQEIRSAIDTEATKDQVRYNGMMDNKVLFDGNWYDGSLATANTFTVGKYYSCTEEGAVSSYISVNNDKGERVTFRRSHISFKMETQ
jgi:LysM repeat protein